MEKDTRIELTEERVREIVREELSIWAKKSAVFLSGIQPSRPPDKISDVSLFAILNKSGSEPPCTKVKPETVEAIRRALEAWIAECPAPPPGIYEYHQAGCKGGCHGTGRIPDPAVAPLLALVRETCPTHTRTPFVHKRCGGTGYITRTTYWQEAPEGALTGSFIVALTQVARALAGRGSWQTPECFAVWRLITRLHELFEGVGISIDQAALDLVLSWAQAEHNAQV